MEKLLERLFDYQRFAQSPKLASLIEDVERSYPSHALSDDELESLAAAGDPFAAGGLEADKDGKP